MIRLGRKKGLIICCILDNTKMYDCLSDIHQMAEHLGTNLQQSNVGLLFVSQLIFPIGAR